VDKGGGRVQRDTPPRERWNEAYEKGTKETGPTNFSDSFPTDFDNLLRPVCPGSEGAAGPRKLSIQWGCKMFQVYVSGAGGGEAACNSPTTMAACSAARRCLSHSPRSSPSPPVAE
jgi:hypothetical protein